MVKSLDYLREEIIHLRTIREGPDALVTAPGVEKSWICGGFSVSTILGLAITPSVDTIRPQLTLGLFELALTKMERRIVATKPGQLFKFSIFVDGTRGSIAEGELYHFH